MDKLTGKEEKFAQLVVSTGNQSEAYRQAYVCKKTIKPETVWTRASELMSKSNVSARVDELKQIERERHAITRDDIIQGYLQIIQSANETFDLAKLKTAERDEVKRFYRMKELTSNADKLRALDSLAKMLGLNEPDKVEVKDTSFKTEWG